MIALNEQKVNTFLKYSIIKALNHGTGKAFFCNVDKWTGGECFLAPHVPHVSFLYWLLDHVLRFRFSPLTGQHSGSCRAHRDMNVIVRFYEQFV